MNKKKDKQRQVQKLVERQRLLLVHPTAKTKVAGDHVACEQETENNDQERPTSPTDDLEA